MTLFQTFIVLAVLSSGTWFVRELGIEYESWAAKRRARKVRGLR